MQAEKLPPASPDFNPIENAWALLQKRLLQQRLQVGSVPNRLRGCEAKKGARTNY